MANFKGKLSKGRMYFRRVSQMLFSPLLHFVFLSLLKVGTEPCIQKMLEEPKLDSYWFNLTFLWKHASCQRQNFLKEVQNSSWEKIVLSINTLFQIIYHCDVTLQEYRAPYKISERSLGHIFKWKNFLLRLIPLFELKISNP